MIDKDTLIAYFKAEVLRSRLAREIYCVLSFAALGYFVFYLFLLVNGGIIITHPDCSPKVEGDPNGFQVCCVFTKYHPFGIRP